jgi:hypothetical protein
MAAILTQKTIERLQKIITNLPQIVTEYAQKHKQDTTQALHNINTTLQTMVATQIPDIKLIHGNITDLEREVNYLKDLYKKHSTPTTTAAASVVLTPPRSPITINNDEAPGGNTQQSNDTRPDLQGEEIRHFTMDILNNSVSKTLTNQSDNTVTDKNDEQDVDITTKCRRVAEELHNLRSEFNRERDDFQQYSIKYNDLVTKIKTLYPLLHNVTEKPINNPADFFTELQRLLQTLKDEFKSLHTLLYNYNSIKLQYQNQQLELITLRENLAVVTENLTKMTSYTDECKTTIKLLQDEQANITTDLNTAQSQLDQYAVQTENSQQIINRLLTYNDSQDKILNDLNQTHLHMLDQLIYSSLLYLIIESKYEIMEKKMQVLHTTLQSNSNYTEFLPFLLPETNESFQALLEIADSQNVYPTKLKPLPKPTVSFLNHIRTNFTLPNTPDEIPQFLEDYGEQLRQDLLKDTTRLVLYPQTNLHTRELNTAFRNLKKFHDMINNDPNMAYLKNILPSIDFIDLYPNEGDDVNYQTETLQYELPPYDEEQIDLMTVPRTPGYQFMDSQLDMITTNLEPMPQKNVKKRKPPARKRGNSQIENTVEKKSKPLEEQQQPQQEATLQSLVYPPKNLNELSNLTYTDASNDEN